MEKAEKSSHHELHPEIHSNIHLCNIKKGYIMDLAAICK
jgi:hypothetical protein